MIWVLLDSDSEREASMIGSTPRCSLSHIIVDVFRAGYLCRAAPLLSAGCTDYQGHRFAAKEEIYPTPTPAS